MPPTLVAPPGESPTRRLLGLANAVVAVLSAALCFVDSGPLRWLAGAGLALVLPGDAIRRSLGVARSNIAAAVFTGSASLAATVFVGLAVDQLNPGITARTMAIGLVAITLVADAASFLRGPETAVPQTPEPEPQTHEAEPGLTWKHYVACLAAFAIPAGLGVTLSVRASESHDRSESGTALSIVQQGDTAVVEVIEATPGQHSYVLDITSGGVVLLERSVTLNAGHEISAAVDISRVPTAVRVTAALTPAGTTTPLRSVWLVR